MKMLKPFKFLPNRVLRLYTGGSGIDRLCGNPEPADTRFPENWIASCIEGNGRAYHSPGHGVSRIEYDGAVHSFPEFLHEHAEEILGVAHLAKYGETPAVLTKLLDSAEQLPMQVHPSRADAKKFFNADYGKTEAWLVLATRKINGETPYLLVGFNEKLDKETFVRESLEGEYKTGLGMLNKIAVRPGDVIVIRGWLPHAIGPGVTMVEVMEPSDLVIVPEINCCGVQLSEKQRFAGIAPADAMSLFDFTSRSEAEIRALCTPAAKLVEERGNGTLRSLIPFEACGYFAVEELAFRGSWELDLSDRMFRIGVVCDGSAEVNGLAVRRGESFLLPYSLETCGIRGSGCIMFILPPRS